MKMKRERDQNTVTKYRHSKQLKNTEANEDSSAITTNPGKKDDENFINYLPKDHHTETGYLLIFFSVQFQNQFFKGCIIGFTMLFYLFSICIYCYNFVSRLSVGTSFEKQVLESVMDLTGDDSQLLKNQRSLLKWDMKRKNFVSNSKVSIKNLN